VQVATFSVHAHSPYTVAQPLYETTPVRLACSGYNGTVFTLLPFPEDEIAYAAVEQAVQVRDSSCFERGGDRSNIDVFINT
jgi:hypothetical protein